MIGDVGGYPTGATDARGVAGWQAETPAEASKVAAYARRTGHRNIQITNTVTRRTYHGVAEGSRAIQDGNDF